MMKFVNEEFVMAIFYFFYVFVWNMMYNVMYIILGLDYYIK